MLQDNDQFDVRLRALLLESMERSRAQLKDIENELDRLMAERNRLKARLDEDTHFLERRFSARANSKPSRDELQPAIVKILRSALTSRTVKQVYDTLKSQRHDVEYRGGFFDVHNILRSGPEFIHIREPATGKKTWVLENEDEGC